MSKSLTGAGIYGGTVTSINLRVPPFLQVTPGPIRTSGTFTITTTEAPTGSGAIVLADTPTLITPNIGAATGTSITVTNLISTTATGLVARFGSAPVGVGVATNIKIQNSSTSALELCLASTSNQYSTGATAGDSVIRAIGGSNRLFLQSGTTPAIVINSDNTVRVENLTSCIVTADSSKILRPVAHGSNSQVLTMVSGSPAWTVPPKQFNYTWYSMLGLSAPWPSGSAPWSGDGYQPAKNWSVVQTVGEALTYLQDISIDGLFTYDGIFQNLTGRKLYVLVSFSARRDFGANAQFGISTYTLAGTGVSAIKVRIQTQEVTGPTYANITAMAAVENGGWLSFEGRQTTGVGNNFVDGNGQITILN